MPTTVHTIKDLHPATATARKNRPTKKWGSGLLRRALFTKVLRNKKQQARLILLALAILCLWGGWYIKQISHPIQPEVSLPSVVTFASEPVTIDGALIKEASNAGQKTSPVRVMIPEVQLDVAVKDAPIVKGYWTVFADRAGFGLGSSYPEDEGNTVIFAHARERLFQPLKEAKVHQSVYVLTGTRWYHYEITEIREVLPNQKEVIAPTDDATLTLYTCTGFSDSKRLVVIAKRV